VSGWKTSTIYLSFKAAYPFQDGKSFLLFRTVYPLVSYLFFIALGMSVMGSEYLHFILVGNIVYFCSVTILLGNMQMYRMDRLYKTLELTLSTSTSPLSLFLQRAVISMVDALIVFAVSLLFAVFLFDLPVGWMMLPALAICLLTIVCSVTALSLIVSAIALTMNNVNLFHNLVSSGLMILTGVNVPIAFLPPALVSVSSLIPVTHGLQAIREVLAGMTLSDVSALLGMELLVGAVYLLIAVGLIFALEKVARRTGGLLNHW
jgi:ABC-2 type transport system permease protein